MENRRKEKRFKQENDVLLQFAIEDRDSSNSAKNNALTYDLSLNGVRIITKKYFPVETVIRTEIDLASSSQHVVVDGKVRWVKELDDEDLYAIGVEFLHDISKTVLALIAHLYGKDEGVPSYISETK